MKKNKKKSILKHIKSPLKTKKKGPDFKLKKSEQNPIIKPIAENGWESWQTFNPGVVQVDDKVYFLYRAIGGDGVSRFGYAVSDDGFNIEDRVSYPIYEHSVNKPVNRRNRSKFIAHSYASGGSFGGCEDSRLVQIKGEDTIYLSYTACDGGLRMALNSISTDDFKNQKWKWGKAKLISPPGEVHKNWVIFPEKINGKYAIIHSIKPDVKIAYLDNLDFEDDSYIESEYVAGPQKGSWEKWVRGVGPPPIKTKAGWLLLYHGMDGDFSKYKIGAMLLDLNDPSKILCRSHKPVLVPDEFYENCGYKSGVVYASGAIIKNGNLLVYYGGADTYVCVAYCRLEKALSALKENKELSLKTKKIRTNK